jgi:hypothetical protein
MTSPLLVGLHENLWASLRHTFNTDRILLGVAYLVSFATFLMLLALLPEKAAAAGISLICLVFLNVLIFLSLRNSRDEVMRVLSTLQQMYKDNDLGQYFGVEQATYYARRYRLWLTLQPSLMVLAVVVALAIEYVA